MCNIKAFKDWLKLDHEELNKKRLAWGVFFFVLGISLLIAPKFNHIYEMICRWIAYRWGTLLWVVGWSSIGIGIGLINSRTKEKKKKEGKSRDDQNLHYITYYLIFALSIVSLAAYALGRNDDGTLNKSLSALIGLTLGFAAERINQLGVQRSGDF